MWEESRENDVECRMQKNKEEKDVDKSVEIWMERDGIERGLRMDWGRIDRGLRMDWGRIERGLRKD